MLLQEDHRSITAYQNVLILLKTGDVPVFYHNVNHPFLLPSSFLDDAASVILNITLDVFLYIWLLRLLLFLFILLFLTFLIFFPSSNAPNFRL